MLFLLTVLSAWAVEGESDDREFFPHTVSIQTDAGEDCTGSILHARWVVTSASCLVGGPTAIAVATGPSASRPDAILDAVSWQAHPDFDAESGHADLALIEVDQDLPGDPLPVDYGWAQVDEYLRPYVVGYGVDGSSRGPRGFARVEIADLAADPWRITPQPGVGFLCRGDTGAPILDEALLAVLGAAPRQCSGSPRQATPIAPYRAWLDELGVPWTPYRQGMPVVACLGPDGTLDLALDLTGDPQDATVTCTLDVADPTPPAEVRWSWRDGSTSTTGVHTYTTLGLFGVEACFDEGGEEVCAYGGSVKACAPLDSELTLRPISGLLHAVVDKVDELPAVCIDTVALRIYDRTDSAPIGEVIDRPFAFEFPAAGEYRLELVARGPLWDEAITTEPVMVMVEDVVADEGGCSSVPGGSGVAGLALVGLLLGPGRRRRRS